VKILFLDFDGVLNNTLFNSTAEGWELDPRNIAALNLIIEKSGAKIVVSSSWRYGRDINELQHILDEAGCRGYVIDVTPRLMYGAVRGDEIQAWLDCQTEKPTHFVILDDDANMAQLDKHAVRTLMLRGLGLEHVEPALKLLGVE
jgi:hypothetical protein